MGVAEIGVAMLGSGVVSSIVTAWATLRGKSQDTLHLSEVEFRKALLQRVDQLERRADADAKKIAELERENDTLREKISELQGRALRA